MSRHDEQFRNKTIVITGGSTGIGAAFAARFAAVGARLVLVARTKAKLDEVAATLRAQHGVVVDVVAEDLGTPGAARRVHDKVRALGVVADVLVNNAGFASFGTFHEQPLALQNEEIQLNVVGLVELSHVFLPDLLERKGGIIHVASTAGFQPVPTMAVYGATKAFVLSFSEALWAEYRGTGLRVLALCPGATATPFFERTGPQAAFGAMATTTTVVDDAFKAWAQDRPTIVSGITNFFVTSSPRFFPRRVVAMISRQAMWPRLTALPARG